MKKFRHLRNELGEKVQFKVDVEGLPPTFMTGKSSAEILAQLRKIVKQPSMIKSVERQTDMEVKRAYKNKAQGREMDEAVTYHGNPNKDDDARNAARRRRLAKQDKPKKVNEISQDLKKRYTDKAKSDYGHQQFSADIAREMGAKDSEKYHRRKQRNRMAGITKASK